MTKKSELWAKGWGNKPQQRVFDNEGNQILGWEKYQHAVLEEYLTEQKKRLFQIRAQNQLDWRFPDYLAMAEFKKNLDSMWKTDKIFVALMTFASMVLAGLAGFFLGCAAQTLFNI
ncbi:MAG: hypothetical protein IM606_10050 [Cytophagales bacterium]|jgi:hypothetical protein|nr:hypothetical protein [Cytophagales bacterium]